MELKELGGKTASIPDISFYSPEFGQHFNRASSGAPVYSLSEGSGFLKPECFTPFVSFSRSATGANTQVAFGCRVTSSCYTCPVTPDSAFQQSGTSHSISGNVGGHSAQKQDTVGLSKAALRCHEVPGRVRDLGLHQNYTGPYPYSRMHGYIDVPVAQRMHSRDQRRESFLSLEGFQPWNWSSSWTGQVYCPKEQTQSSHIWKSSLTEDTALSQSDTRLIRKKRVPYTKLQLKELEHEYTFTKFITKERRRRIASSTNLSERQVTIWFQNRRVKDKKIISKISKDFEPYQ